MRLPRQKERRAFRIPRKRWEWEGHFLLLVRILCRQHIPTRPNLVPGHFQKPNTVTRSWSVPVPSLERCSLALTRALGLPSPPGCGTQTSHLGPQFPSAFPPDSASLNQTQPKGCFCRYSHSRNAQATLGGGNKCPPFPHGCSSSWDW